MFRSSAEQVTSSSGDPHEPSAFVQFHPPVKTAHSGPAEHSATLALASKYKGIIEVLDINLTSCSA
jgi:hypothetical protein